MPIHVEQMRRGINGMTFGNARNCSFIEQVANHMALMSHPLDQTRQCIDAILDLIDEPLHPID